MDVLLCPLLSARLVDSLGERQNASERLLLHCFLPSSFDPNAILICCTAEEAESTYDASSLRVPLSVSGRRQDREAVNVLFSRTSLSTTTHLPIGSRVTCITTALFVLSLDPVRGLITVAPAIGAASGADRALPLCWTVRCSNPLQGIIHQPRVLRRIRRSAKMRRGWHSEPCMPSTSTPCHLFLILPSLAVPLSSRSDRKCQKGKLFCSESEINGLVCWRRAAGT